MSDHELRLGDYRTALADVERVDCVLTDPPYSARTHEGQISGLRDEEYDPSGRPLAIRGLEYTHWAAADVAAFAAFMAPRCSGWFCVFTSHDLAPAYDAALTAAGRYVFAPLACTQVGRSVRLAGDGPANWTDYLVVSRPRVRKFAKWGSLPGAYVGARGIAAGIVGGAKPLDLMRAIVRDYSRPGDLICDPCAGGGTTIIAARMEGRRSIGAEWDAETHRKATARIDGHDWRQTGQVQMFPGASST